MGDLLRMTRLVRDPGAHWGYKALVLLAIAYVVSPVDAVPEAIVPLLGFFDDVGLIVGLRLLLERQLAKYRYPLFASPPVDLRSNPPSFLGDTPRPAMAASKEDPRIQVSSPAGSAG